MARYQRAADWVTNVWYDTETGESFTEGDTPAGRRFKAWTDAGNMPDLTPFVVTHVPVADETRSGRIAKLAAQAKQGLADPSISTPGEKRMAAIFGQALDALAALDPLPSGPVTITVVPPPDPVVPLPAPPSVQNAGVRPVRIQ